MSRRRKRRKVRYTWPSPLPADSLNDNSKTKKKEVVLPDLDIHITPDGKRTHFDVIIPPEIVFQILGYFISTTAEFRVSVLICKRFHEMLYNNCEFWGLLKRTFWGQVRFWDVLFLEEIEKRTASILSECPIPYARKCEEARVDWERIKALCRDKEKGSYPQFLDQNAFVRMLCSHHESITRSCGGSSVAFMMKKRFGDWEFEFSIPYWWLWTWRNNARDPRELLNKCVYARELVYTEIMRQKLKDRFERLGINLSEMLKNDTSPSGYCDIKTPMRIVNSDTRTFVVSQYEFLSKCFSQPSYKKTLHCEKVLKYEIYQVKNRYLSPVVLSKVSFYGFVFSMLLTLIFGVSKIFINPDDFYDLVFRVARICSSVSWILFVGCVAWFNKFPEYQYVLTKTKIDLLVGSIIGISTSVHVALEFHSLKWGIGLILLNFSMLFSTKEEYLQLFQKLTLLIFMVMNYSSLIFRGNGILDETCQFLILFLVPSVIISDRILSFGSSFFFLFIWSVLSKTIWFILSLIIDVTFELKECRHSCLQNHCVAYCENLKCGKKRRDEESLLFIFSFVVFSAYLVLSSIAFLSWIKIVGSFCLYLIEKNCLRLLFLFESSKQCFFDSLRMILVDIQKLNQILWKANWKRIVYFLVLLFLFYSTYCLSTSSATVGSIIWKTIMRRKFFWEQVERSQLSEILKRMNIKD